MGRKIDGFILSLLSAALLYLYFYRKIENHAAALALAAVCFLLLSRLVRKALHQLHRTGWMQRRRMRRQCGGTLMQLACMDSGLAAEKIEKLLEQCYGKALPAELLQLPPSASLTQEQVFQTWKRHCGEEKLVICCTCGSDSSVRSLCKSLKQPKLALLDAGALSQLIAEHPEDIYVDAPASKHHLLRIRHIAALLFNRRNAPRCLLFSAVMLLMYLLGARPLYLASSMLLLFAALASFHRVARPAKLF